MKGFSDSEAKKFINFIKKGVQDGKDLTKLFKEYSLVSGRAQGSLRNYYYKTVNNCKKDCKLKSKLGVTSEMYPTFIKAFNESEEESLLKEVLLGLGNGKSVRSTISKLANNNDCLALRYQNKYRNLLRDKREFVMQVASTIKDKNGIIVNPYENTVFNKEYVSYEEQLESLIKKLIFTIKQENMSLKEKVLKLEKENKKLKDVFKKCMKQNSISKEFFNKNNDNFSAI